MSRVETGLAYNSLTDHHLTKYFSRPRRKQHLRQSGLIRRDGEIISEASLYAESLKKDQKQQAKEAILRSLEWRKDDLARNHQALCLRTIEEIEKIERVRRIRSGDKNGSAMSYTNLIECAIVPASICHRPISANLTNGQTLENLCYSHKSLMRSRRSRSAGVGLRRGSGHEEVDEDELQFNNPSDYFPVLPRRRKSKKRKLRQADRQQRKRAQSLKPRQTGAEEDDKRLAMMTMKYFGDRLHLENDQADPRVQVLVEQQHCGGNTLIVFRDKLLPGTEFSFPSYRHTGFPYSLTIYVNGHHDSRLSVCCEYKHRMNARLGGKSGNFAVVGVKRGRPCHSCMMKYGKNNRNKTKSTRDLNRDSDDSSSDSRGDNDEDTAMSRFSPAHRNRIRIPVDDEENDRNEEYGKEINRRTNEAKSPELERKPRKSSGKKSRDPYDHFSYDIQVPVDDEDNGNNNNDGGGIRGARRESLKRESPKRESPRRESPRRESPGRESQKRESPKRESPKRESPSREQQMKSRSQSESSSESGSDSGSESGSRSGSSSDSEGEKGRKGKDTYSKGSACTEEIEKVKPKSSRSQRESNHDDESASESGS